MSTVLALPELELAARDWRRDGAVIVLCCGCFDPLHVGHVQHLRAAKAMGNVLVVSVTADEYVRAAKGPTRPRSPAEHRAEVVASVRCVDAVVVGPTETAVSVIEALRPHIYVKGAEFDGKPTERLVAEMAAVELAGGRVEYLSGQVVCSSTVILAGM